MMEQGDTDLLYVEAATWLDKDLADFERLKSSKYPPVRHLRSIAQAVVYLMGDASGKGFVY